jgi:hypothetical protein
VYLGYFVGGCAGNISSGYTRNQVDDCLYHTIYFKVKKEALLHTGRAGNPGTELVRIRK